MVREWTDYARGYGAHRAIIGAAPYLSACHVEYSAEPSEAGCRWMWIVFSAPTGIGERQASGWAPTKEAAQAACDAVARKLGWIIPEAA